VKTKELIVAGAVLTLVTYTLVLSLGSQVFAGARTNQESRNIPNAGEVRTYGVGVYEDVGCENKLDNINWGVLEPGSSEDKICYIENEGNSASTLSMDTSNWSSSEAEDHISLSWDYGGQCIDVDEVVQVTFTLAVDASIEGITNFSFDIIIVGNS